MCFDVYEIEFPEMKIIPGKTRVLETREPDELLSSGMIVDICRKGYRQGDKIMRVVGVR